MSLKRPASVLQANRASGSPSVSRCSAYDARKLPLAAGAAPRQDPAAAPRHDPVPLKMAIGRGGGGAAEAARMSRSDEIWKARLSLLMLD